MSAIRLVGGTAFIALFVILPNWSGEPSKEPRSAKARVDLYGDPLPEGAIARLGTVRFRHAGSVHAVGFSEDGKLLAASSDGRGMVVIWDRATGRKLREIRMAANSLLLPYQLHFSANNKRLYGFLGYGEFKRMHAWDVGRGMEVKDLPPSPARPRRLLLPQFDGQAVGIWDAAEKKQLWSVKTNRDKDSPVLPMAFSADGKLFAVEAPQRVISVHESVSGKMIHQLQADVGNVYWSLCISPDARTLAASNWDGSLRLWDLRNGRERGKIATVQGWVTDVFFAPDSKVFATGGPNNPHAVLLWDAATGKQLNPFSGHTGPVSWVSFAPDGRTAATCSWIRGDMVVRVWETRTGRLLRSLDAGSGRGVTAVAFSPDGQTLAASDWDGEKRIRIWNVRTGRVLHELMGHARYCTCVAFSPDGKRLASGDPHYSLRRQNEGRLCIWDAEAGKLIREIDGTRSAIQEVLFTPDGRHILAAANGVYVFDADSGRPVGKPFQTKTRVWRLSLSADGRLLATADGLGGPVRLWELATRREIALATFNVKSEGVALTPDGRTLATSDSQGNVVLFHWPCEETIAKLSGNPDAGSQVFFSPDGRLLATANNRESTALIWDVANLINRPLPAVAKPSEEELRRWWSALRDDSPAEAYKAVWRFAAVPEQTLPFLANSLQPAKPADSATVARLIDDLDSDQFQVREKASRELGRLGEVVVVALRKAKSSGPSLEQRLRIERLLAELTGPVPGPEQLRAIRAVAVLEQIGGAQARKIVAVWAGGAAGARLTEEAQTALERLKRAER
jgi:WD40 repeat protein